MYVDSIHFPFTRPLDELDVVLGEDEEDGSDVIEDASQWTPMLRRSTRTTKTGTCTCMLYVWHHYQHQKYFDSLCMHHLHLGNAS